MLGYRHSECEVKSCKERHGRLHLVMGWLSTLSLVLFKAANADGHVEPKWIGRNGS